MGSDFDFDVEHYLKEFPNLSLEDLEMIRDPENKPVFCKDVFEFGARTLNLHKGREKTDGKLAVRAGPLFQVIGVEVQPIRLGKRKFLGVYGEIYTGGQHLYNRDVKDLETLGPDGGTLTLMSPSIDCRSVEVFLSVESTHIFVKLFDEGGNVLVEDWVTLEYATGVFEEVKIASIRGDQVVFKLKYLSIPLGVYARLGVLFFNKLHSRKVEKLDEFADVYGRVVARYENTFGNYNSEEIVLFEKGNTESKRVEIDSNNSLDLSRCWVAVPAYSMLVIHLSLFKYGSGEKIVEESIKLEAHSDLSSGKRQSSPLGDVFVKVRASWFPPKTQGLLDRLYKVSYDGDEVISTSAVKEGVDSDHSWTLHPHMSKPRPSPAIEVFSIVIGREKLKAVEICGSVEVSYDYTGFNVFNKDERAALSLLEGSKSIPLLNGYGVFAECCGLKMSCDLKDVSGSLSFKGYVEWDEELLDGSYYHDDHLCAVIQGDDGFAALNYIIFASAVQANLKISYMQKKLDGVGVPTLSGSLFAGYDTFQYLSQYEKDCFRTILFRRTVEDSSPVDAEGMIPLSRSSVIVPTDSSLVIDIDLLCNSSSQRLLCTKEFKIGATSSIVENDECIIRFEVEWSEIK